jgi:hypothetical protein
LLQSTSRTRSPREARRSSDRFYPGKLGVALGFAEPARISRTLCLCRIRVSMCRTGLAARGDSRARRK